jgi:2-iminobutanoate/2-iminopropanoate deaminase
MSHHRQAVGTPAAPAAVGPYSQGMVSNGLLFCSGQVGLDPDSMTLVSDDVAEQARQCLRNLSAVCEAGGTSLADAVRVAVYLADINDWAAVNAVYETFFVGTPPARTAIAVSGLPVGAAVEIDAIVALPD